MSKNIQKLLIGLGILLVIFLIGVGLFKINPSQMFVYLLLLACPLLHIFMMDHSGHSHESTSEVSNAKVTKLNEQEEKQ